MNVLAETDAARVYHCAWQDLAAEVGSVDTLIVDAPYSARTHAGHDDCATGREPSAMTRASLIGRAINYAAWGEPEISAFVKAWSPLVRGWIVTITDYQLAPVWSSHLEEAGRYVFSPLPFVAPGSRVRLSGDGPSSWTCWIVVARPRTREMAQWGTLPGAYILTEGHYARMPVVGGKPPWLMQALARDYSRPGDLVCDPCCGAGTTLIGAVREGRRAVGGDLMLEHAQLAAKWIRNPERPAPNARRERHDEPQRRLFAP